MSDLQEASDHTLFASVSLSGRWGPHEVTQKGSEQADKAIALSHQSVLEVRKKIGLDKFSISVLQQIDLN